MVRLLVITALLAAAPALAKAPHQPRIMLLDIPPDETFKPNITKALNDFLAGALGDQGFVVVTSSDIGAALGIERQKALLGCSENSCLAEIGGAMGAEYIVRGNVAVLDQDTALTLSIADSSGRPVNLARKLVAGRSSSALLHALEEMVPKLVAPIKPATATAAAGGLAASAEAPPPASGGKTGAYALLGLGGAGLLGSGVLGFLSYSNYKSFNSAAATGSPTEGFKSSSNLQGGLAWGTLAVGAAAATVGAILLLGSDSTAATGAHP